MTCALDVHCVWILSMHSFVCLYVFLSVSQSGRWSVGPFVCPLVSSPAGSSAGCTLCKGFVDDFFFLFVCQSVSQLVH